MGIFHQPPQPFTGGRQPSDQARLPPVVETLAYQFQTQRQDPGYILEQWWVPAAGLDPTSFVFEGGRQPFEGIKSPPSLETATLVGVRRGPNPLVEQMWPQPGADPGYFAFEGGRQPFEPRKLSPTITAVPVVVWRAENQVAAQQQEWPQPVNDPAYYSFFGGRQPFEPKWIGGEFAGQPVASPNPTRDALTQVLEQWWVPPGLDLSYFTFEGGAQPFHPKKANPSQLAVTVNPALGLSTGPAFAAILAAWLPDDPTPTLVRHLAPATQVQPSAPTSNWQDRLTLLPFDIWQDPYAPPQLGVKLGHTGSSSLSIDPPPKMYSVEPFAGPPFTLHFPEPSREPKAGIEVDLPPSPNQLEPYAVPGLYQNELGPWILIPTTGGAAIYQTTGIPLGGIPYAPPPVFKREDEWTLIPQSTRFDQRGGASNQDPPAAAPELANEIFGLPSWLWDPPAPLPTLPVSALHTPFGPPPPSPQKPVPAWLPGVLKAWEQPDPLPQRPTQFAWPTPSFTDVFVATWESVVLSAWVPADPPPTLPTARFRGVPGFSLDPPKPRDLENQTAIVAAWTPADPLPQLGLRTEPPTFVPPFYVPYSIVMTGVIFSTWAPADPPPTLPRTLNPSISGAIVNQPPIGGAAAQGPDILAGILAAWVSQDPTPALPPHTPILSPLVTKFVPSPEHLDSISIWWQSADPLPTLPRNIFKYGMSQDFPPASGYTAGDLTQITAVAAWWIPADAEQTFFANVRAQTSIGSEVDYPPPQSYRATETIIAAWQPSDPLPKLNPFYIGEGVSVDQPPLGGYWPQDPAVLAQILAAWAPADPPPTLTVTWNGWPGWSINQPPPRSLGADPILPAWRDPDPTPTRENLFVFKPAVTPSIDNPPFRRRGDDAILAAWVPADPPPTLPTARFTGAPGWSVDTLPGYHPFVVTWPPDPPLPWVPFYLVQRAPTFVGHSPWNPAIVTAWQPPDPQPTLAGKLSPSLSAVRTDQPPRTQVQLARLMATIATWWIPPDPIPTLGVRQIISNVGTQVYLRRRMTGARDRVEISGQRPRVIESGQGIE